MNLSYKVHNTDSSKDVRVNFEPPLSGYDEVKPRLLLIPTTPVPLPSSLLHSSSTPSATNMTDQKDPVADKSTFLCMYMSNHPDTLVAYVKFFGKVKERVVSAKMTSIDSKVRI